MATKSKPPLKKFTLRMPLREWRKVRALFDPKLFTDNKAAIHALNQYVTHVNQYSNEQH